MPFLLAASYERPRPRRSIDGFYQDLKAQDTNASLQAFGNLIISIEAPNLNAAQLSTVISAAQGKYRDLDFGL